MEFINLRIRIMRFVLLRQETRDRARENVYVLGVGVYGQMNIPEDVLS